MKRAWINFDEVKAKIGLPQILEKFGIKEQFEPEGQNRWTGPCPLPSHPLPPEQARAGHERNREQFKITAKRADDGVVVWVWFCHAGDHKTGGDQIKFVKEMLGGDQADYNRVREWFGREFGDVLSTAKPKGERRKTKPRVEEDEQPPPPEASEKAVASEADDKPDDKPIVPLKFALKLQPCEYLQGRGISVETAQRYGVGLCTKGHFKGHAVFPIFRCPIESADENPVSYAARATDEQDEKSKTRWRQFKDFPMASYLFGINEAMADTADDQPLIVVEGAVDVLMCYEQGIKGAVCPIGAYLSEEQIALLRQTGRPKLVLMFDGDDSGIAVAKSTVPQVAPHFWTRIVTLPDAQDPADCQDKLTEIVPPVLEDHSHCQAFTSSQETLATMAEKCWVRIADQPIW